MAWPISGRAALRAWVAEMYTNTHPRVQVGSRVPHIPLRFPMYYWLRRFSSDYTVRFPRGRVLDATWWSPLAERWRFVKHSGAQINPILENGEAFFKYLILRNDQRFVRSGSTISRTRSLTTNLLCLTNRSLCAKTISSQNVSKKIVKHFFWGITQGPKSFEMMQYQRFSLSEKNLSVGNPPRRGWRVPKRDT